MSWVKAPDFHAVAGFEWATPSVALALVLIRVEHLSQFWFFFLQGALGGATRVPPRDLGERRCSSSKAHEGAAIVSSFGGTNDPTRARQGGRRGRTSSSSSARLRAGAWRRALRLAGFRAPGFRRLGPGGVRGPARARAALAPKVALSNAHAAKDLSLCHLGLPSPPCACYAS